MVEASDVQVDALMDHAEWVRRLARRLVRDPEVAEDLAQETLLAALERDGPILRMRGFLRAVLHNVMREHFRGEGRRRAREDAAAVDESGASTADLVAQMSAHRAVVETLMGLAPHYREVLLWRYFEGETPSRIAERHGIPVSTVKTRLARGLAAMREQLDRRHGGDGRRWLAALAPIAARRGTTSVAVKAAAGVLVAALVFLCGGLTFVLFGRGDGPTARSVGTAPVSTPVTVAATEAERATRDVASEPPPPSAGSASEEVALFGRTLRGEVIDVTGRPRGAVVVRHVSWSPRSTGPGPVVAVTDREGRFELRGLPRGGRVEALSHDLVTVLAGVDGAEGALVVVAPRTALSGTVHDEVGRPLTRARLEIVPPDALMARVAASRGGGWPVSFVTFTDASGAFALDAAPRMDGARLIASLEGFVDTEWTMSGSGSTAPPLTLARPDPSGPGIHGTVRDHLGAKVADARVSYGSGIARTDAEGRFFLPRDADAAPVRVVAVKHGSLPAVASSSGTAGVDPIELRLGEAPRTLHGVVVDREGRGLPGAEVWIDDPTLLSVDDGGHGSARVSSPVSYHAADSSRSRFAVVESELHGRPDEVWPRVTTDADGRFELGGLCPREYRLVARDQDRWLVSRPVRVAPDNGGCRIVIDRDAVHPRIEGVVRAADGAPVAGARVRVEVQPFRLRHEGKELYGAYSNGVWHHTGADGTFRLRDVPTERSRIRVEGPWIVPAEVEPSGPGRLEIVVHRGARVRVETGPASPVNRFQILSEDGEVLRLHASRGAADVTFEWATLHEGVSELLLAPVAAKQLVLHAADEAVGRVELELTAGRFHVVRP